MDRSAVMSLAGTWLIMIIWLGMVVCAGRLAFTAWRRTDGLLRRQMLYLWVGPVLVVAGDFLHSIAFTVAKYTGDPTGPIRLAGQVFEFRTFAMFFDGLVFILYYGLWALFIVARYRRGVFQPLDRACAAMSGLAALLLAPGMVPNAFGLYTLNYDIAIWSPHMVLFVIFGPVTVWQLLQCARAAAANAADPALRAQEQALAKLCWCLFFSFAFFILTLALRPINEKFALFMIPKTFAYMTAFYFLISGFLAPLARAVNKKP